jgi:hypothetical protein
MRISSSFRSATNRLSPINGLPRSIGIELSINIASLRDFPTDSEGAKANVVKSEPVMNPLSPRRGPQI